MLRCLMVILSFCMAAAIATISGTASQRQTIVGPKSDVDPAKFVVQRNPFQAVRGEAVRFLAEVNFGIASESRPDELK